MSETKVRKKNAINEPREDPKIAKITKKLTLEGPEIGKVAQKSNFLRHCFFDYFWHAGKSKKKKDKIGTVGERGGPGGAAWQHARAGGEDPRRGIRTAPGQDFGKSSRQERRSQKNLTAI